MFFENDQAMSAVGRELLANSFEFIPIPILISECSNSGDINSGRWHRFSNQAFRQQIGYSLEDMPDIDSWFQLAYPDAGYRAEVMQTWEREVERCLASGQPLAELTALVCCADGQQRWFIITAQTQAATLPFLQIITFRDVHELKCTVDENIRLSRTDFLTRLLNRREASKRLQLAWEGWQRAREMFSVLLCDIDGFKHVNDQYGHACGDHMLVFFADQLTALFDGQADIVRWGGEEFLLILPATDLAGAAIAAERLRQQIADSKPVWQQQQLGLTVSIGYTCVADHGELEGILHAVDVAMYRAKLQGRNCICQG
ncbi:GGDEF domain-containing protein [Aquitalea sp. FJL05]|uniref:sensor domain-containing diguanylate cyclase n=1 Tax=Aquitalea sp. FJL05 TaxID=2153366 RepID=UPI000F59A91E|nr:sensor domain-containing diguanylate cyclase [Aquitalea sp. FJL05]RQO76203.1 GGDEF domain-containing protein [Aquitalea sp. FJL05]